MRRYVTFAYQLFPATVVDKSNYQPLDVAVETRSCPKWEDVVKK